MTPEEFISISGKLKAHLTISQRTLENLLHWSLSQMEGMRTEFQHVAIKILIDEVCRLMDEIAVQKNIQIEVHSSDTIMVVADPNQMQLVFRNLIHNAIKFSKPGDTVVIETLLQGTNCLISVKDFGVGITEKEIIRLKASVDHFTKAGTQQEKGTGLGLLLCKEFINGHHGKLNIESKPGNFTKFSFNLPLAIQAS
jgi:signal transduction histidine kinase